MACAGTFLSGLVFRAVMSQAGILIPVTTYYSGNSKDFLTDSLQWATALMSRTLIRKDSI